jgi:hypothetical protein
MITKTRPSKTIKSIGKEERSFVWAKFGQIVLQTIFTLSVLYVAHTLYIYVWRMTTGH